MPVRTQALSRANAEVETSAVGTNGAAAPTDRPRAYQCVGCGDVYITRRHITTAEHSCARCGLDGSYVWISFGLLQLTSGGLESPPDNGAGRFLERQLIAHVASHSRNGAP